jgi:hypothetical protein
MASKYIIPHGKQPSSSTVEPTGNEGQVWTWFAGKAQWEYPAAVPVSAQTYGMVCAPSSPLTGPTPVTVFTIVFPPCPSMSVVHVNLQGIMIDLTDDPSTSIPDDIQGVFRIVDYTTTSTNPPVPIVGDVGMVVTNDSWFWRSVYNVNHNETSLVLSPSLYAWSNFSNTSQWTFNFQMSCRFEYTSNVASQTLFMPQITSTYSKYVLNQVYNI